jgi:uncharacterized cofD-like protein
MKITVIGGGTGTAAVLKGLKNNPDLELKVIVTMMDDGGSNAIIRKVFGLLPISDIRKAILALADDNDKSMQKLFEYRFDEGDNLRGHTIGNLVMAALSKIMGSEEKAIEEISSLFKIKGEVIPVTNKMCRLVAEYSNGKDRNGEHRIDEPEVHCYNDRITHIFTKPTVTATDRAISAIMDADFLIAGPGDLYTSIIPNLLAIGIPQAIRESKAKYIYISNLMTKAGQTRHLSAKGLFNEITSYSHRSPDIILINNGPIPQPILDRYQAEGDFPIFDDLIASEYCNIIRKDFIQNAEVKAEKGDDLKRSYIRHDEKKLAKF